MENGSVNISLEDFVVWENTVHTFHIVLDSVSHSPPQRWEERRRSSSPGIASRNCCKHLVLVCTQALWNDCANRPTLVAQVRAHASVGCVLADAEFDSERYHTFVSAAASCS